MAAIAGVTMAAIDGVTMAAIDGVMMAATAAPCPNVRFCRGSAAVLPVSAAVSVELLRCAQGKKKGECRFCGFFPPRAPTHARARGKRG